MTASVQKRPAPVTTLGSHGKAVLKLEKQLDALGYLPGKVDGVFDQDTFDAVKAYKTGHSKRFAGQTTGAIGPNGLKIVSESFDRIDHGAYRARVKPNATHRRLDALTASEAKKSGGLGPDATGRAVLNVQERLKAAGYGLTGKRATYGEHTRAMVEHFQRKNGLDPTGTVDARTWSKLSRANLYAKGSTSPHMNVGERDAAVKRTEQMLHRLGYHTGKVDGLYDSATAGAVKRFQKHELVKETGVGDKTLHALRVEDRLRHDPKLKLVREMALMAKRRGLPAELPIMTALVESNFKNVSGGDRDSVGMFQQRDAWGPFSVRHDPIKSARMFFEGGRGGQPGALDYKSRYAKLGSAAYGRWCQAVQVSAFPERYQTRLAEARQLLHQAGIR